MNNRLIKIFAVVLCMIFITVAAMAVSAVEGDEQDGGASSTVSAATSSVQSTVSAATSSVSGNSSKNNSDATESTASSSDTASDAVSGNANATTSSNATSLDNESGNAESSSATSSGTTSSKTNRPIHSTGDGGNNFISEDGDQLASHNATTSQTASTGSGLISEEYVEDDDSDIDYFEGKADTVASNIYKIIWIPILISLLCIGALIYVNIWFQKKYPKRAKSGANSQKKDGPHRRKKSKKFKFTIEK